jgi:hypothetical protein
VSGKMVGDAGIEMCSRVGTDWRRNQIFDAAFVKAKAATKSEPASRQLKKRK